MGIGDWWAARKRGIELTRRSVEINDDEDAIAANVPELVGMGFVKGAAHTLGEIDRFRENCTPEQAAVFAGRLTASRQSWADEGLTMPYWGNLWVLRKLQADIAEGAE
jgi:hypothetical protein